MPNNNPQHPVWDFVIVGGGAAGFFAAITCAEAMPSGSRVLILEKTPHVLGKVKVSGGGRCNVTHACFDPQELAAYYPRGNKSLIGPFHRWGTEDTVTWFSNRGVELKTEADGRMFPVTDNSQTIIDCLSHAARDSGVIVRTSTGVKSITTQDSHFQITTEQGDKLLAHSVLLATGGTRLAAGARLAASFGHTLMTDVPSLFAFQIDDPRISGLAGISVSRAEVTTQDMPSHGPLLITHHGLSGPGILKLSAWRARELHKCGYRFTIKINWLPDDDVETTLVNTRQTWGKRLVRGRAPLEGFPKRLWARLCTAAGVQEDCIWSQLSRECLHRLIRELTAGEFQVTGKSINKDEFVTCGGVPLNEVNLKTMESKLQPSLYFAGEILDIDGITGGFNFQNAWTSGFLAGSSAGNTSI